MYKIYQQIIDQVAQKIDAPKQVQDEQIKAALLDDLVHRLEDIEEGDEPALLLMDRRGLVNSANGRALRILPIEVGQHVHPSEFEPNLPDAGHQDQNAPTLLRFHGCEDQKLIFAGQWLGSGQRLLLTEIRAGLSPLLAQPLENIYGLTPTEQHILNDLVKGMDAQAIADQSDRKTSTVRQHIKSILNKTNARSQAQLVAMVASAGTMLDQIALRQDLTEGTPITLNHDHLDGDWVPYRRFGLADGCPVLFFHGAFFGIMPQDIGRTAAHILGLDVIAIERPGYGANPLEKDMDPVDRAMRQAKRAMDHAGWKKAVIMGQDIGTHFAFAFARTFPQHSMALICGATTPPMGGMDDTEHMPKLHRVNAWAAQKMPAFMHWIVNVGIGQIQKKGVDIIPQLLFADAEFDRDRLSQAKYLAALETSFALVTAQQGLGFTDDMRLTNLDWWDWLDGMDLPVHLFHGQQSQTVAQAAVEKMAQRLPQAQLHLVEDAGHSMPFTHANLLLRQALRAGILSGF
ncbi:pimeloyl-ACP methyl ester carboxylesterase [Maritalea mobilis]|uniref:Pimeloyl-ACP methyl ester carboxylesterase n=1 Tax=Maritalea mobilis TaxID=483324 RepID=A0A4R6VM53_9HYPH|nr:alpha/beta fold hydrolase [Maritalea mobilis]TDQ60405.1 pimeloyl-ACP methyl ester carboxylesterase [Maritalea mobilis]